MILSMTMTKWFHSPFDRDIYALALPALLSLIAEPLVSMVDTIFVGRISTEALAALGVNTALFAMAFTIFLFLAYGTTPMIAKSFANRELKETGLAISQALILALLLGVLSMFLLQMLAIPLLKLMGTSQDFMAEALVYLRIRSLSGPALLVIMASNGIFRGFQNTRTPLLVGIVLSLINLVLDALFILVFHWGIAGAAFATLIAQYFGAALFLYYLFAERGRHFELPDRLPELESYLPFLKVAWELILRSVALIFTLSLASAVATRLGAQQVAAHQILNQIIMLSALSVDALAVAAHAMIPKYVGQGDWGMARALSQRLLQLGLAFGGLLALLLLALSPFIPSTFSQDTSIYPFIHLGLLFLIIGLPLNALLFVWDGIFMGLEAFNFLAIAMLISAALAIGVLLLVIPLQWGYLGVWIGISTLMLARISGLAWAYYRGNFFAKH